MEGSLVAYKVFTNGSVLQASEVNENLMQQAVATFSNAAARTAAITSPVEGQLTYLLDVDRYDHWNGSSWVSPFGATLVSQVSFTTQTTVNLSNIFTSSYQNYSIWVNISSASATASLLVRMLLSGTPAATNYFYSGVNTYSNNSLVDSGRGHGATSLAVTPTLGTEDAYGTMAVFSPNQARDTTITYGFGGGVGGNYTATTGACLHSSATAYDGIQILPSSGNISGTIRVYGMRNI